MEETLGIVRVARRPDLKAAVAAGNETAATLRGFDFVYLTFDQVPRAVSGLDRCAVCSGVGDSSGGRAGHQVRAERKRLCRGFDSRRLHEEGCTKSCGNGLIVRPSVVPGSFA
jgi:hypothetical protein